MIEAGVAAAAAILRRHGIPYVVIGGQAIARSAATTTRDVDVMVATGDFARTVKVLREEPGLAFDWETRETARFRILSLGGVPLDVINGSAFAGNRSGEEFFRYLADEGSSEVDGVAFLGSRGTRRGRRRIGIHFIHQEKARRHRAQPH